jgi:hypothetical protein
MVKGGGGRRRRWPPRRRARSPEGERAAVEQLSDGAHVSVPRVVRWRRSGEHTDRPVRPRGAHQGDTGGGDDSGKPQVGPLGRCPLILDLGLGLGFFFALLRFDSRSISRSFLFPKQDLLPNTTLIPLIDSLDRLGVDRVGKPL